MDVAVAVPDLGVAEWHVKDASPSVLDFGFLHGEVGRIVIFPALSVKGKKEKGRGRFTLEPLFLITQLYERYCCLFYG